MGAGISIRVCFYGTAKQRSMNKTLEKNMFVCCGFRANGQRRLFSVHNLSEHIVGNLD